MNDRRRDQLDTQEEGLKAMKEMVEQVHPDSLCDVGSEAICHIIEHFTMPEKVPRELREDFVFMLYNTHVGMAKIDPNQSVCSMGCYYVGNINMLAHQLAHMMRVKPEIAQIIFHAMHAYHHDK